MKLLSAPELFSPAVGRPLAWAGFLLRILFGGLFLISGALKAMDPGEFLLNIRSFQMIQDPWAASLAVGLPWLEIFGGVALVLGSLVRGALLVFMTSIIVFLVALAQAWARDLDVTCGCFGRSANQTDFPSQIAFDVALLATGAFLWWHWAKITSEGRPLPDFQP